MPILFFLSGATALIYEVLWSKYLALMFGSTAQAQTVVLAVFMGGLALGNAQFGKWAATLKQPLAIYGGIELAIGLYALLFHSLYNGADAAFIAIGSKIAENSTGLLVLKGFLSVALLMVPTVLMGGTLPLVAAWLERGSGDAGRSSARFYSINSLGAVFGAAVAGFYLVRVWGMTGSLQAAAAINMLLGAAAIFISRRAGSVTLAKAEQKPVAFTPRKAIALVTVTGAVSMGLEILASRAVGLVVGGSPQAFAIVLMAFILGIGLGAAIVSSPFFSRWQTESITYAFLLAAAALVAVFIYRIQDWAVLYTAIRKALPITADGYVRYQFLTALLAILALGIPAALLGAVLPMAIRNGATGKSLANHVGVLLTWNTLGAVAGVLFTGFLLMPKFGLRTSFLVLALFLSAFATAGLFPLRKFAHGCAGLMIVACLSALLFQGDASWNHILGSGLYRLRNVALSHEWLERRMQQIKVYFYKDGPDATVAVETGADPQKPQLILRINGKADASTHGDLATQYLLGHLPFTARPDSKDIFILGFGSGITGGAVLGHPIDSLTIAENCGPVIEAAPLFEKWNRSALKNPRTHLRREDARTVLKLSPRQYDVIISEPSNPWVAGIGSVFTQEFYRLCRSRLKEGCVMTQWFHIYETDDEIIDLILSTFSSVFPHFEIWEPEIGDIILVGSTKPWESSPAVTQKLFERAEPARDLEAIGVKIPQAALALQLASQKTACAIPSGANFQTDNSPILEYAAPRAFFRDQHARGLFLFDERTRQAQLAPVVKRQSLSMIPEPILHSLINESFTYNAELAKYLAWRASHVRNAVNHPIYDADPNLPFIFRPPNSYSSVAPQALSSAQDVYQTIENMMAAEAAILRQSDQAAAAAKIIEDAARLEANRPASNRAWQPARFVITAARAALARSDQETTVRLLDLVEKLDPAHPELPYLRRLLAKRGVE